MTRVLILDEEPTTRVQMAAALQRGGFEVVSATDVGSAWRVAQAPNPPMILVLSCPACDADTRELVARVRSLPDGGDRWVILLSARDGIESRRAALEAGGDDYLVKPVDAQELRGRVHAAARLVGRVESLARELARRKAA